MSHTAFSARQVYNTAPLGSLIRFYDGTPEPPGRHRCKHTEWFNSNGTGRLVRKTPASDLSLPAFKVHVGDFGGDLTIVQAFRSFAVSSELRFAILGRPRPGQAAVLHDEGGMPTLVHLARTVPDAETWLTAHPGYRARIVPADASVPRTYPTCRTPTAAGSLSAARISTPSVCRPPTSPRGATSAATPLHSMSTATCRSS